MTNHSSQDPDPEPRSVTDRGGMSFKIMAAIALAAALVFGLVVYSANRDDQAASTTATSSGTQGQAPSTSPAPKGQ